MPNNKLTLYFTCLYLFLCCLSCTSDQVPLENGNKKAEDYFNAVIQPILEEKCNSCHTYHNTSLTRYDAFRDVANSIDPILKRIDSNQLGYTMPPSNAVSLTADEKAALVEFLDMIEKEESDSLEISIEWEAFKFPFFSERVGVVGRFNTYGITINNEEDDIFGKLQNGEIRILANSVQVGESEEKTSNLLNYFFEYVKPVIFGKIKSIDQDKALVSIMLNGVVKEIEFSVTLDDFNNRIIFIGKIEDLYEYDLEPAFLKLDEKCGIHHEGKVWPDVNLKIEIKNYHLL